jgi:quercetin dioxygenase-like cupin family protein
MTRTVRLAVTLSLLAFGTPFAQESAPAQPNPSGSAPKPVPGVLGPAPNFIGNTTTLNTEGYNLGRRVFAAGARNARWHAHSAGQLVFGEKGRGRLQIQGQPIQELGVGDSAFIPGGSFHWHGASPNEDFTMVYITMGASKTSQGDPVTEDVYSGKKK